MISMNTGEWATLKSRYATSKQYSQRKVLFVRSDFEDFTNWLIDQGADILAVPAQDEALRFKLEGNIGIVYGKGSGNLLAHDLGIRYYKENGHQLAINHNSPVGMGLEVKAADKFEKTPIRFEYCFSCKEVQELCGDQCSACMSYIVF